MTATPPPSSTSPPPPASPSSWSAWRPHIRTTLAILCAIICIAAVIAWITSYLPPLVVFGSWRGSFLVAGMGITQETFDNYATYGHGQTLGGEMGSYFGNAYYHFLGFAYTGGLHPRLGWFRIIAIPYWFIVLLTAIQPIRWWRRRRLLRHRHAQGRCPGCGYDLTGTPGRCPECGWRNPLAA
jgi:hypothetical protein